jgi:hypothetical protein
LRGDLEVEATTPPNTRQAAVERGETLAGRNLAKRYFVQMKGMMRIAGRLSGKPISGDGAGFFETYR